MSGDIFNSHDSLANNTLGSLETAMEDAVVFRKGVSIENGTFPSLEGLLFDTPISPISQSIYGRKELSHSPKSVLLKRLVTNHLSYRVPRTMATDQRHI